jgi:hypothetical protein
MWLIVVFQFYRHAVHECSSCVVDVGIRVELS